MLAPFVPTIDDDTELQVACAYVATKLKQIPDIETYTSSLCTFLVNQGIYCIGVLKATKFTPDQMDTLLKEHGMAGFRRTFEFAWKMSFTNPEAPAPGKLAVVKEDQSHLRPSRFVIEPDMIGKRLKKLGILKDVRLSPRLDDLIVNKTKPTPDDFDEIVKESVLYTFKVYGVANVDQLYLDTLCAPLNDKYTDLPEGKVFYKAIFHKTNNARKLNAKSLGKLPRCDLSPECIKLIEEKGYPVEIVENAPSVYAPYYEKEGESIRQATAAHARSQQPQVSSAGVSSQTSTTQPAESTPSADGPKKAAKTGKFSLGQVGSTTAGFRSLPPKPSQAGPPATTQLARSEEKENDATVQQKPSPKQPRDDAKTPGTGAEDAPAKRSKTDDRSLAPGLAEPTPAAQPTAPQTPAFDVTGWVTMPYSAELLKIDQKVAHFFQGAWHVGRVSHLNHQRRKWAEYTSLPWVKSHKKGVKGKVPPEFSHAFNAEDHGSLWFFVREEYHDWISVEDVSASADVPAATA